MTRILSSRPNLLMNGGFEDGTLACWEIVNPSGLPVGVKITLAPAKVHGGHYAAEISGLTNDSEAHCFSQASGVNEEISGRYKPEISDLSGGANVFCLQQTIDVTELPAGTLLCARMLIKTENLTLNSPSGDCLPFLAVTDKGGNHGYGEKGGGFAGTCDYIPAEILYQLGADDSLLTFQLRLASGIKSGTIYLADASIEVVDPLGDVSPGLPDCRLVRDGGGTPRLQINGQVVAPLIFFGNTNHAVVYEEVAKAAAAGVDIFQTCMDLPWAGTATSTFELALQANPRALFMPRLFVHPPRSWREAHPDQMVRDETGSLMPNNPWPSLGSDLFFGECRKQIELFIRYLHNSPYKDRIIGIMPGYMAEGAWFYYGMPDHYFDYSEVNLQKFIQWLRGRYAHDIKQLNTAWNRGYADFDEARIPPPAEWDAGDDGIFRDPNVHRAVADYLLYHNQIVADRIIELSDLIKELTDHKSLVAVFYGYHNETVINGELHGNGLVGQLGTRRVLEAPSVDILAAPLGYHGRQPGGPLVMMSVVDSAALAGKLYLQEDDSRTHLWNPPPEDWTAKLFYPTEWDTLQCLRRNFGNVLAHNQAIWWMDLAANGSFNSDSIWENNRKLAETYRDSIRHAQATRPEVALLYDENTFFWLKSDCYDVTFPNISEQRNVFQSLGAPVGYYYIQDLDKIPDSVRLFVFVNPFYIDAPTEALVHSIKTRGRTLLWLYAPGYVSETGLSLKRMEELTGFALGKLDTPMDPALELTGAGHAITNWVGEHRFGASRPISPLFCGDRAADPDAVSLGHYAANGKPALLLKEFEGWRSIFCGAPSLSVPVLRGICREAGVKLLVDPEKPDTEDAIACNGRYLYVYARGPAGPRQFQSPGGPVTVSDAMSGEELARNVTRWSADFQKHEQRIFKLVPVDKHLVALEEELKSTIE